MYPDIVCEGSISKELKDGIKKRIIGLLSYKIYDIVYVSVDAIVISAFLGLKSVALYNNYIAIINVFIGFLVIINSSLTAGVGNKMVTNTRDINYIDFKNLLFAYSLISSFFIVLLVSIFQNFMIVWLGKEFLLPTLTVILLLVNLMISRLANTVVYIYRQAAGLWWEDRFNPVVQTIVNLSLNLILVQYIGMNGVILSTTFCSLCIAFPWGGFILFKYYFKYPMKEYYQTVLYYMLTTITVSFISYTLCNICIQSNTILTLITKILISTIISSCLFILIYRKRSEFIFLVNKIRDTVKYIK